ncbi:MAG: ORF6N domain-containing protein [Proteobacteria bacterium]|nr:ORF6N domain-containing protein [Pseudomonadota bacterium]
MSKEIEIKIEGMIYFVRGHKIMLDNHLASLYGVETKVLNQAVKRNIERFPSDFMFQLNRDEFTNLRSQIVTSSPEHGGRRGFPVAFTENGVAMLSSVLNSKKAIKVNILIMKTFTKLRRFLTIESSLSDRIDKLEQNTELIELNSVPIILTYKCIIKVHIFWQ